MVLQEICFVDSLHGWVLSPRANHEYILRTVDGGTSWQVLGLPQGFFTLCSFVDSLDGWISGYDFVFRTTNGGYDWEEVSAVYNRATDLQFLTDSIGWITEDGPVLSTALRKTSDGGLNWSIQFWFPLSDLTTRLFFIDALRGWVVPFSWGDPVGAQIWHTSDGGSTWDLQFVYNPPFYFRPWRVFFSDPRHGWIVGEQGIVLKTIDGGVTSVFDQDIQIPKQATLRQNYPNPFNATTTIEFNLSEPTLVTIKTFDLLGRYIATLMEEKRWRGTHRVTWDASALASGVYFILLSTSQGTQLMKAVLMR